MTTGSSAVRSDALQAEQLRQIGVGGIDEGELGDICESAISGEDSGDVRASQRGGG